MRNVLLFVFIIATDQITKLLSTKDLLPSLGGLLKTATCNPNIAWGIPVTGIWFWLLWLLVMYLLISLAKKNQWNVFLLIVLIGAISNFIDRIFYGCVVDFVQIGSFPTFNLADIAITGGVIAFLFQQYSSFSRKKLGKK